MQMPAIFPQTLITAVSCSWTAGQLAAFLALILFPIAGTVYGDDKLTVKREASVFRDSREVAFPLGSIVAGTEVRFELRVKNETGSSLNLEFLPSCGCLSISPSKQQVDNGEFLELAIDSKTSSKTGASTVHIQCADTVTNSQFTISLNVDVVERVVCEPQAVRLASKSDQNIKFRISSSVDGVKVDSVVLVDEKFVEFANKEDGSVEVIVPTSILPASDDVTEQTIAFLVRTSDSRSHVVVVPVEYSDRVKVSPSILSFRQSDDRLTVRFLLVGGLPDKKSRLKLKCIQPNQESPSIELRVDEVKDRSERVRLVFASAAAAEFQSYFDRDRESESLIEVICEDQESGVIAWKKTVRFGVLSGKGK